MSEAAAREPVQIIVCVDHRGGIGYDGRLLYHISEDLARFKRITAGTALIMGRKTYESLPRLLVGRKHIVITHSPENLHVPDAYRGQVETAYSLNDAIDKARQQSVRAISIIGGEQIYRMALDMKLVDVIQATVVFDTAEKSDAFFPKVYLSEPEEMGFREVRADLLTRYDPKSNLQFKFFTYHRKGYGDAVESEKMIESYEDFFTIKQRQGRLRVRKEHLVAYGSSGELLINLVMRESKELGARFNTEDERNEALKQLDAIFLTAVF